MSLSGKPFLALLFLISGLDLGCGPIFESLQNSSAPPSLGRGRVARLPFRKATI